MADINRQQFLPAQISAEIIKKTQDASAVMQLARKIPLPGTGVAVPVITSDPTAEWVAETAKKPVSNSEITSKLLQPYKIAVIETVSNELIRDAAGLYDELVSRLPASLAVVFDNTIIGGTAAPGNNFDTFASCTAQNMSSDAYGALVAADLDIATHGGILNGFAISPQAKSVLLSAVDGNQRPLFINSVAEGAIPMILGSRTVQSKALYKAGTSGADDTVGVAGDWTQAVYGTVEGVQIKISEEATVGNINLFEQNMVAIRAEIEVGFRADTDCFNLLTVTP